MKVSACAKRPILKQCGLSGFDYQIDTYIGCEHYCYYCYVLAQAETDWSKEVLIHEDIVDQLGKELEKIPAQTIYMGYYTDPYQPCESNYIQTRKVLELLLQKGFSASILTKSDLVVRDLDILRKMKSPGVSISVAFNDNQTRSLFEANTVDTEKRIDALCQLKKAGIRTGALVCPVIPYVTDVIQHIDKLQPVADEIWIYGFSIERQTDQNWLNMEDILKSHFRDLRQDIEEVIFSKEHNYWKQLREKLVVLKNKKQLNLIIHV